ncbi:hypothetical protein [Parabacteroides bouchesdurhonensis]|uniref:hypothetical protein n=1 Tax=Parabacteroides bouchesdurhonensis TaxID=1936995 RepID=UPI000C856FA4|nr:hypothetical protein [Parabacteroides bouchesdurhonensis]
MNKDNYFGRLLALLLLTLAMCLGMYWLPDRLFGYKIKKVDLLSDIRVKPQSLLLDSLKQQLEKTDTVHIDSLAVRDSVMRTTGIDSIALAIRDSLYKAVYAVRGADSLGMHIEDYSVGHIGLKRFFSALNNRQHMKRPVRIAFLGDSFIEGDIMVADFRSGMQKEFGGRGVGFIPVHSATAQYRPTVEQSSEGWTTWSMLTDRKHGYTLSGMMFEAESEEASVSLKTTNRYPELQNVSSLKLIYEQNTQTEMAVACNDGKDTLQITLPPTSIVTQYELDGNFNEVSFTFTKAAGLHALGIALEDNTGVVVDNFSLRGNSGLILERLDMSRCQALNKIRPYDLIVLQYGLNVVSDDMLQYGWYRQRMVRVICHLQSCFPQADILMLGVSDRSKQEDGKFETMPAVLALLHAQRLAAKQAGVPFWNVFGAMGGENSMVRYVENNWASKDYTHLSFRGGKEIASSLLKALLSEKKFYDEAEKTVY